MYGLSLTPDGGTAVHVFRCVFEQAVTSVMVLDVVEGNGLKAPPAQRQDERVTGFSRYDCASGVSSDASVWRR